MKKLLLLTKTLLAAALLCVGQNAWADWTTVYSNDYTDADTYAAGWTNGNASRITWGQMTRTDIDVADKTAMKIYMTNLNNGTTATFTGLSGISAYTTSEKYKIEFDFGLTTSNNQVPSFIIYASDNSTALVTFTGKTGDAGNCTFTTKAGNNGSFYCPSYSYNTHSLTDGAPAVFNHVLIEADEENGTKITISGDQTVEQTIVVSTNMEIVGKMVWDSKKYMTAFAIDNLTVSVYSDTEIVPAPSASVTGVDGANRTVTMNLGGGSTPGTVIKYYTDTESKSDLATYSAPFVVSSTSKIYYYAESTSGATSDEQSIDVTCVAVKLNAPSILRTGANTYTITPTTTTTDGITAAQTIHYTIGGGSEQTGTSLTGVDGDIVAWATATGFTKSDDVNMSYVAPIAIGDVKWTYNLNNYPSAHACTAIANAIDEDKTITIDDVIYYNLKDESYPNLYVSNGSAWLLRNQAGSAWKAQNNYTDGKIVIANAKTTDVIYFRVVLDAGKTYNVTATNATLRYSYNNQEYFYVPNADGNVILTMPKNAGMSIYDVKVSSTIVSKTITAAGWATYCSPYALDLEHATGLTNAYIVTGADGENLNTTSVKGGTIPANTGILIEAPEGTVTIPVVASSETNVSGNKLVGVTSETVIAVEAGYVLMADPSLGFYKNAKAFTVGANTAYLPANIAAGAARSAFFFGGNITGVENVEAAAEAKAKEGKFIENGKLVIVKNGVKFNAAGAQVK